jgi:hypothetical protein
MSYEICGLKAMVSLERMKTFRITGLHAGIQTISWLNMKPQQ